MAMRGGPLTRADVSRLNQGPGPPRQGRGLGVVAHWHRNLLRRLAWSIRQLIRTRN